MHQKLNDEEIEDITAELKSLTLAQQQCLLFLACSILSKRTCIVQGTTASGKSHSIRLFAKMLGQKLNVYQMNKDTDISFLTGQSVLSDEITEADEKELKAAFKHLNNFKELKTFIDNNILNKDKNAWKKDDFTELLKKISKYEINRSLSTEEKNNLKFAGAKIRQIMSPARRFIKKDSNFMQALENGEWVLIDGIENAPPEIAEKLSSLCGDIQELDLFEGGENCYFSRTDPNGRKIHENFHLFVTYNPSSKTTTKILDPIFLNKCVSFTIPAIDSSINSSSRILIANLMKMKYDNDFAIDFGQRFAVAHQFAKKDSKADRGSYAGDIQFNGRTLTFILREFNRNYENHKSSLDGIDHTIYRALYLYYWNSYINKENKKQFKADMIKKLAEDPQQNNFIVDIQNIDPKKKYEVLLNYLRNIQLYACKNLKEDNIKLNDFIEKCGKIQLSDISFIVGHFIDTLKIINQQISIGDERKNSLRENQYSLINIITSILKEIEEWKRNIGSKYLNILNLQLISDDNILLSVEKIKKPIARLTLLYEISKTNNFCRHVPYIAYDKIFLNILNTIVKMSKNPKLSNFNIFMSKLHENQHLISLIDKFFPYHLFRDKQYKMILYWMPIIRKLYDKKITFHIKIISNHNEIVHDFIFPEYENIEITYVFKEENSLLISSGSMFFKNDVSKSFLKKNNNNITIPNVKTKDELEKWNKKFYKCSNYLLRNMNTTISRLNDELETYKLDLPEISIHYPYLSQFYDENIQYSLIYKELSIVFNFEFEIIDIFLNILHPVEADLLHLVSHIVSNIDSYLINEIVDNVNAFSYFGDQKSKLWVIYDNQYPSLNEINDIEKERDQIENELKNLKELPKFDEKIWPYQNYIKVLQSKIEPLNKKILEKLEGNETKKVREQLKELRNKLEYKSISNKECLFLRKVIVNSINKISEESPTNANYDLCYTKVQQFFSFLDKKETKYSSYIWPNHNESRKINKSHNIKIYENVIWFSRVKALLDKICAKNNDSPFEYIFKLNEFSEMHTVVHILMKQIMKNNETETFQVDPDDKNIIYSTLNAHFISKFIFEHISDNISSLDKIFNNLSLRNVILGDNEIEWIYQNANKYNSYFNLVLPEFTSRDLLYLFIGHENDKIVRGPLVSKFKCQDINVNKIFEDSKNIDFEEESFASCADKIIISIMKICLNDESFSATHSDLKKILKDKIQKTEKNDCLKFFVEVLDISDFLDKSKAFKFIHNDVDFLKPKWIENTSYVEKYPSLAYWLIKNPRIASSLQNMYSNSALNDKFLPFWLFVLRIMSSLNCIVFDTDSKTNISMTISQTIKKIIQDHICKKKMGNLGIGWLSLVLSSVPSEIIDQNYRMFYHFLIYLSKDEKIISNQFISDCKDNAIRDFTTKVCELIFSKNKIKILAKPFANFSDNLLNFINDPSKSVNQQIKEKLNNKKEDYIKKIENEYQNSKIEDSVNTQINDLEELIQDETRKREKQFYESLKKKEIENMNASIDKYNKLLNQLKSNKNEDIFKLSSSVNELINIQKMLNLNFSDYNKKNSLTVFRADWNKIADIQLDISKKKFLIFKSNNKLILSASSEENYYITESIYDNVKITPIDNNEKKDKYHKKTSKNEKKMWKNEKKSKKDIELAFNWTPIKLYEIIKNEGRIIENITKSIYSNNNNNIPSFRFGKDKINSEEFIFELKSVNKTFSNMINEVKACIKNETITEAIFSKPKKIKLKYDNISSLFIVKYGNDNCIEIQENLDKIKNNIEQLKKNITEFDNFLKVVYNDWYKIAGIKYEQLFDIEYQLPYPSQERNKSSKEYMLSFNSLEKANFLSIPILFVDEKENKIKCCYEILDIYIGPLIPSLYSGEWIINFISFIDSQISIKIELVNDNYKNIVSFSSERSFLPGEAVQIAISMESNQIKDVKEFSIKANLKIESTKFKPLNLPCNFNFKLAPLSVLISCNKYNFSLYDDMIYLCAPQILPNSVLHFPFQIFYVDEKIKVAHQIIDFDDNEAEKPDIKLNLDNNELILYIKNTKNIEKLHCMLKVKFLESVIVNILIDAVIIPFDFDFEIYDYSKHKYVRDYSDIYYSFDTIDRQIILHCRIHSSSFFSYLTATINNDFRDPISLISTTQYLQIPNETDFDIVIKMKNSYYYSLSYHIYVTIGEIKKTINLKFTELKLKNTDYKTNYYNPLYFNLVPVYGYDWMVEDWKIIDNYSYITNDIIYIVSPLHIIDKIKLKERISIPRMFFEGWNPQSISIYNGLNNSFFLINDKLEIVEKKDNKYTFSTDVGIFGITQNNWYPMFKEYPQYFEHFSILEMLEINIETANNNICTKFPESYLMKKISFNDLASLISEKFEAAKLVSTIISEKLILALSSHEIEYYDELIQIIATIEETSENDPLVPIIKNNFIFILYKIFKNRYDEIFKNSSNFLIKIDDSIIHEKVQQVYKEYIKINSQEYDEYDDDERKKIKNIKEELANITFNSQSLDQYKSFLFNENDIPKHFEVNDIPKHLECSKTQNSSLIEKTINVKLPDIIIPEKSTFNTLSVQSLNQFYQICTEATRLFPIYVKNMLNQNPSEIINLKNYFFKLLQIYQPLPSKDYSFISKSVNTFSRSFESMIRKFENAGVDFGTLIHKKMINTEENDQEFIQYPDKIQIIIPPDDWKTKNKLQSNSNQHNQVIVNANTVSSNSTYNVDTIPIPKSSESNKDPTPLPSELITDSNNNKSVDPELVYTSQFSLQLKQNNDQSDSDEDEDGNESKKKTKKITNPYGSRENVQLNDGKLDGLLSAFKEEDGIKRAILLMNCINPDGIYELHSYNVHPFDEKLYKNPDNEANLNDYSILPLINQSFIISQEFIKVASTLEIPFSTICVNILVDCSKFISKENKLYNMMIICALTDAITTFGIPYSVSVIGDSNFKCIIKPFSENHSYVVLQRICECMMIDRFLAELPECIHYAINDMKYTDDSRMNRAIFTFTNGLDDNIVQKNSWKALFDNKNISFGFVFIKSNKLSDELTYLEKVWDNFEKDANKDKKSVVAIAKITSEDTLHNQNGEVSELIKSLIQLFVTVLQGNSLATDEKIESDKEYIYPVFQLSDEIQLTNLSNFIKYNENKYDHLNNIFIRRTDVLKNMKTNMSQLNVKHYSNNINKALSCKLDDSLRRDFPMFIKLLIQSKRNNNTSSREIIFKPNKASRLEPSTTGTIFDISALILYLINPVPEPMIYLEEKGGLILNYGVSVVIDLSYSCFNPLSVSHSFQTIISILSSLSSVDLPCFDLIIATNSSPIVLCSGVKTLYALNERSSIWNSLFAIIQNYSSEIKRADLASAINAAFDLRRMRSIQCTNILFVLTDGLYQLSERTHIINSVNNCVHSGMNTFGIGMGIYPKGIENLFPQVIFAENPSNVFKGISVLCENDYYDTSKSMSCINSSIPNELFESINSILTIDKEKGPMFKSLVNELSQIPPTIRAFRDFMNIEDPNAEITPDIANPEGDDKELYISNFLQSQKILIVQLCDDTICHDEQLKKEYIYKNYIEGRTECIYEAVHFFGIEIKDVQNYEDAIHELTKSKTDKCDYYACWIICGSHPEKLPTNQEKTNVYIVEQFIDVLIKFWKNGGSLVFWADNDPYTFHVNVFLNKVTFEDEPKCPSGKVTFQIHGDDHPGKEMLDGDRTGKLNGNKLFNKEPQIFAELERASLSNHLYHIYEGSTLSYVENVGIDEKDKILPFIPFAVDSKGGITSLFYPSNLKTKTGDIIIDCGFSKLFYELTTEGTYRYIRNIAGWTARPEVHFVFDKALKPSEWRPNAVHHDIENIETPNYSDHINQLISKAGTFQNISVIKENVRKLGGDVFCDLRFSIQWNDLGFWDKNDLDAHCIEPHGFEIMFDKMKSPDTDGTLDVDIVNPKENKPACENIRWKSVKTMTNGTYRFFVHQFSYRKGTSGFRAEIEFNNRIYYYDYRNTLRQNEDVDVALVTLSNGKFTIKHKLQCQ